MRGCELKSQLLLFYEENRGGGKNRVWKRKKTVNLSIHSPVRAIDGVRTRDPDLGKVVLYQLSHYRVCFVFPSEQYILYYRCSDLSTTFLKKFRFF